MYTKLKFSWAHILAFLALIFIGYVSFVGLTYAIDDGFEKPTLVMLGIILVLIVWFIGAQQLKGVDNNFDFSKCIWWERFFIFTSPVVLAICLMPFNHAMNVASQGDAIENTFKEAIRSSTKMFDDYEAYSEQRIENYSDFLDRVRRNGSLRPTLYKEIGFNGTDDDEKIKIEVQTLKRQLTENYDSLNVVARAWIDRVNQKTSVWNVFLVGNIKEIETAILDWNDNLKTFSNVILSTEKYEDYDVEPFDADEADLQAVISKLDSLSNIYTQSDEINYRTIIWGIIFYFLLLFPYLIQERNGVSTYRLLGRRFINTGIDMSGYSRPVDKKNTAGGIRMDVGRKQSFHGSIEVDVNRDSEETSGLSREERRKKRQERRAMNDLSPNDASDNEGEGLSDDVLSREERHRIRREKRAARNRNNETE